MDDDSPAPGRRSNGLSAAEWGALVDLDPRLSGAMLERLAAARVPAYAEPAAGSDPLSRASSMPTRPLDRLWVDTSRADDARSVVGAEVAELTALLGEQDPGATASGLVQPVPRHAASRVLSPPVLPGAARSPDPAASAAPADDDAAWREIVEGFSRDADTPVPPWPVSEDVEGGTSEPPPAPTTRRLRRRTDPDPDTGLPGWVEPPPVEDEGHYVPPPPPPVPKVQPRTLAAAATAVLGIVLLFAPGLVGQGATSGTGLLGLLLTAGGAAALVWWMRDAPDDDGGPGSGAVV